MPYPMDNGAVHESNGQRLAALRSRRRWTQQRLATESGYSLSAVKAFEQGRRSLDRVSLIMQFAGALDCHPTEITGQPVLPAGDDHDTQDAVSTVAAVHRALLRHGRPRIDREPDQVDLPDLRRRVAEARWLWQVAALNRSGALLPGLLQDLQVATRLLTGDARREAREMLVVAYASTRTFLYKVGRSEATTLATERLLWAAADTGNPMNLVLAHGWYEAADLLDNGEHELATALTENALTELGDLGTRTPEGVSLRGALHLRASLNRARCSDPRGAEEHLRRAGAAAAELGRDDNCHDLQFGPTNLSIWSVAIPVELGRGRDAVRTARSVRLPETFSPSRRSHYWIDLGRGHWYNGQRDEALNAFLEAERIAPQQTRMHPAVRETVRTMIRTQRRGVLQEFGLRVGAV